MNTFIKNVTWYQSKIGEHDKQSWEQTVEGKILASIDDLPKKDATKERRELLDVDLVKGSTFTKAKPSHTSYIRTWKGLIRIIFLPFFYKWWLQHTSAKFLVGALTLYLAQIFVSLIYYHSKISSSTCLFEVTNPLMFMFVLSVVHTQIVFTQSYKKHNNIIYKSSSAFSPSTNSSIAKHIKKPTSKQQTKLIKRKPKTSISLTNRHVVDELLVRLSHFYLSVYFSFTFHYW